MCEEGSPSTTSTSRSNAPRKRRYGAEGPNAAAPTYFVHKQHVHKAKSQNVFVESIRLLESDSDVDTVHTVFRLPIDHNFFFEHALDHFPGLMLVEAGRQAGTAMAHLLYGVAYDQAFILDDVQVRFMRFAELQAPLTAVNTISGKRFKRGKLRGMMAEGYFLQHGEQVAYMKSQWKMIDRQLLKRLRK